MLCHIFVIYITQYIFGHTLTSGLSQTQATLNKSLDIIHRLRWATLYLAN